jgi:hypothetical protein
MSVYGTSSVEPIPAVRRVSHEGRRVVLRLHGDEDVELGRADRREPAMALARKLVGAIEAATSRGDWPEVGDRLIRPGAIVSVDVQRVE